MQYIEVYKVCLFWPEQYFQMYTVHNSTHMETEVQALLFCVCVLLCRNFSKVPQDLLLQLAEALYYKPEGRGFDSRLCHWNFSLT